MLIRKAIADDIEQVARIYDKIHTEEEKGNVVIGWERGIYPEKETAQLALERDDLFVMEDEGKVVGTAILNQLQVDAYENGSWEYDADPSAVMVMHTLVIDPDEKRKGYGRAFVDYYESHALTCGCLYLRMDTNARNAVARRLYKSLGYREIGIVPCVFNGLPDVQLVLIEKYLGGK